MHGTASRFCWEIFCPNDIERETVATTEVVTKYPWQIGIAIDKRLTLYAYFGKERFHVSNGPYDLKL